MPKSKSPRKGRARLRDKRGRPVSRKRPDRTELRGPLRTKPAPDLGRPMLFPGRTGGR